MNSQLIICDLQQLWRLMGLTQVPYYDLLFYYYYYLLLLLHAQQSYTLHTKGATNSYGSKMIQVSGPLIWNRIPEDIQKAGTIFTFKKNLKRHIFDQYRGDPLEDIRTNSNHVSRNSSNTIMSYDNQRWRRNVNQPFVSRWDQ